MKKYSLPKSIFSHFKNGQKSIFELGKSLKLPKMQFDDFFLFCEIDLLISQAFLPGLLKIFWPAMLVCELVLLF